MDLLTHCKLWLVYLEKRVERKNASMMVETV